jgi:hypothetical protein
MTMPTMEALIEQAREHEIELSPEDFRHSQENGLTLDGMPADQWLEAMTAE